MKNLLLLALAAISFIGCNKETEDTTLGTVQHYVTTKQSGEILIKEEVITSSNKAWALNKYGIMEPTDQYVPGKLERYNGEVVMDQYIKVANLSQEQEQALIQEQEKSGSILTTRCLFVSNNVSLSQMIMTTVFNPDIFCVDNHIRKVAAVQSCDGTNPFGIAWEFNSSSGVQYYYVICNNN